MRHATIVVDAVLGTGLTGPARGRALDLIREINTGFPEARVFAIDVPSGMNTDSGISDGEVARADATITFTAPKLCHVLAPNCERIGRWRVGHIGSPDSLMDSVRLHLSGPDYFRRILEPRQPDSNKGTYGHVLVAGGAEGKVGAAEMAGIAALRAGTGLVTVACSSGKLRYPELMTERLDRVREAVATRDVVAFGPGLGLNPELALEAATEWPIPVVIDADGLNSLAGRNWKAGRGLRVLTPHPGEMARLCGLTVPDVQRDRIGIARAYAAEHNCCVILKGHRTVVAFADGRAWINPTGSPAMATGGTGDILTGFIAGLLAQYPEEAAALAGVWLHGRAGELGSAQHGEHGLIATDLLHHLPEAIRECHNLPDEL
jgi:NAD(P)H-hydrate epimerase